MKIWSAGERVLASDINSNFSDVARGVFTPLVLGKNISAGKAVCIGERQPYNGASYAGSDDSSRVLSTLNWGGQVFVTSANAKYITGVVIKGFSNNNTYSKFTVSIRAVSGGLPTGSNLGGQVVEVEHYTSTHTDLTFTFATPIEVSPSTSYAIVIGNTEANTYPTIAQDATAPAYSGGTSVISADGGSSWATEAKDCLFTVKEAYTESGKVYEANASSDDEFFRNFIGFLAETGSAGETKNIIFGGVIEGLSGLVVGDTYYLSNTSGAISNSPGSQSKKIGIAIDTTKLLIKHDNA